ncbi:hypothetical protein B1756_10025 [Natrarchaeobaculum aegyptiacum]|uniref:HTH iclR-type domain-containing protein n=1 Tax=Natrarchaeobaculum aegyptiacum TaxID=745377 RepID=A0A2Z2I3D2_9EURY|nr:hypothetical protein B1756_10025 [Natrarchaeobaculum aegyptiacum]
MQTTASSDGAPLEPADPRQVIRIEVDETGDAHWTIESRFLVTDDEDERLFDEYATAVVEGERESVFEPELFDANVELASAATGREMAIQNAGWDQPRLEAPADDLEDDAEDDDVQVGVVSYSFTWTNFAAVEDDQIHFGDAFQTPGSEETWFPALVDGQRLEIERPPGYALDTATGLTWNGPHQFEPGDLEIVFVPSAGVSSAVGSWWIAAGVVGILLGAGGYVLLRYVRERSGIDLPNGLLPGILDRESNPPATTSDEAGTDDHRAASRPDDRRDPDAEPAHSSAADASTGTRIEYDEDLDDDVDLELLSDEERVHRLLRQNGGRMKQANIVKETGWSNAKVSQLLSKMDDDGEIEKLRIGRENLITLPEVDPTEVD